MMNTTFQSIRVGIFFLLGLGLIYTVYMVIGDKGIERADGYRLTAEFETLRTLTPGSEVRMAGVRIGQVTSTELADGRGRITLAIDPQDRIPSDSVAQIAMASLLGQSYISLQYGKADTFLQNGDRMASEETTDFNAVLSQIGDLGAQISSIAEGFSGLGGGELDELVSNLNALVVDNRERFDTILSNLESISVKLNAGEGTLGRLINEDALYTDLQGVVADFKSASGDFEATLADVRGLVEGVKAGEGTLGRLLVGEELADSLQQTVANLQAFSDDLASGKGTLGKLVTDDSLYLELQSMLNKADQALDSVGDSGPITAVGALSGALF
jgi:phospholipid/cholesterol/gamma-HCH transport system substrate-binding protein